MKFVLNHSWEFDNIFMAWFAGFLQTFVIATVVILNYFAIMVNEDPLEIVMDFLALMVVADVKDFIFAAHNRIMCKEIIQENETTYRGLFKIETTSSKDAKRLDHADLNLFEKAEDTIWVEATHQLEL